MKIKTYNKRKISPGRDEIWKDLPGRDLMGSSHLSEYFPHNSNNLIQNRNYSKCKYEIVFWGHHIQVGITSGRVRSWDNNI